MDPIINGNSANVYLTDSYLKGVISFSECNALGSYIFNGPYLKNDYTNLISRQNPLIEHINLKKLNITQSLISKYHKGEIKLEEPTYFQSLLMTYKSMTSSEQIATTNLLKKIIRRAIEISDVKVYAILNKLGLKEKDKIKSNNGQDEDNSVITTIIKDDILSAVKDNQSHLKADKNHSTKQKDTIKTTLLKKLMCSMQHPPSWLIHWFNLYTKLNNILTQYRSNEVKNHGFTLIDNQTLSGFQFILNQYGCIVYNKELKRITVTTYNQFLTWKDISLSRLNVCLITWISNCLNTLNKSLGLRCGFNNVILTQLFLYGDCILKLFHNEGFYIIKEVEGFIMSLILNITEEDQFRKRFYNSMLNNITDAANKAQKNLLSRVCHTLLDKTVSDNIINGRWIILLSKFLKLIKLAGDNNLNNLSELYFLFRIFGHPMVDERQAMDAVKINCNETKFYLLSSLSMLRGAFIYRIIKGFVNNYNRWPTLRNAIVLPLRWLTYYKLNTYPSLLELTERDLIVLSGLRFYREFRLPKKVDLEMIINDKAISPPKNLIWTSFPRNYMPSHIQNYIEHEKLKFSESDKSRRVLEYYLRDNKFNECDLYNCVVDQSYLNNPNHVVSLTGKERELSVGRMFAMQPGMFRQVQILAEKMIAENILQFFPESLTRYGDLELQKILELKAGISNKSNRYNDNYNNYISKCSIITDLSKFNQAFRYETSCICSDVLDELHGVQSLFSWLHLTIPHVTIICTYRHAPPYIGDHIVDLNNVDEQSGLYRYHMGGIEGWCQKLWTIEAISLLDLISLKGKFSITALINGDNQSIDISKPIRLMEGQTHAQADYLLALNSLKLLYKEYAGIGHKLKGTETYISRDMQFMSKTIQHNGVYYPASIKKVLRVGPWINTILDDFKVSLESIGSLTQELEYRGESLLCSLIFRNVWLYNQIALQLKNHALCNNKLYLDILKVLKHLKTFFNLDNIDTALTLYMNLPMLFGGGDPNLLYRSFYRRTPDFLTEAIVHSVFILSYYTSHDLKDKLQDLSDDRLNKFLTCIITFDKNPNAEFVTLMRDPQALGSERQAKITSEINRLAVTEVLSTAPNKIFSKSAQHYTTTEIDLNDIMQNIEPTYPHGLRVVYESLPFYKAEKIVNLISGTKSITNILEKTSAIDLTDIDRATEMMRKNITLLIRILPLDCNRDKREILSMENLSITELSKYVRERSWSLSNIVGVTSPSIMYTMDIKYTTSTIASGIIIEKYNVNSLTRGERGPTKPWVGSSTQEKKTMPVYNRQVLTKKQRDQIDLLAKLDWVYASIDNKDEFMEELSIGTLGLTYEKAKKLFPQYLSVNYLHRLTVSSRPCEFPASIPAYRTTNYHFDTSPINRILTEKYGDEDIDIVFQNCISFGLSLMSVVEQFTNVCPNRIILIPKLNEIHLMKPPIFTGDVDIHKLKQVIQKQHMFLPDKISLTQYVELFLSNKTLKSGSNVNSNLILAHKISDYFHNTYILSTNLAGHWILIIQLMKDSKGIFEKDWGEGYITDHMFINLKVFFNAYKTYLLCFHKGYGKAKLECDMNTSDLLCVLELIDSSYWKSMSKVFLEQKVIKYILSQDASLHRVKGCHSFKLWFLKRLNVAEFTVCPWVVNIDYHPTHMKAILTYIDLVRMGLINIDRIHIKNKHKFNDEFYTSNLFYINYNFSDNTHLLTKHIRIANSELENNYNKLYHPTPETLENILANPIKSNDKKTLNEYCMGKNVDSIMLPLLSNKKLIKSSAMIRTNYSKQDLYNLFPMVVIDRIIDHSGNTAKSNQLYTTTSHQISLVHNSTSLYCMLPWHHINRFNFVFSSTGCKISIEYILKDLKIKDPNCIAFIGEGAGNLLLRTVVELHPDIRYIYRSLKDCNDHSLPIEFLRLYNGHINIDYGENLTIPATDATNNIHWSYLHIKFAEPISLFVCDAELPVTVNWSKIIIEWSKHVRKCKYCSSVNKCMLIVKYHAQDDIDFKLDNITILKTYVCLGSKLKGSEVYLVLTIGPANIFPVFNVVQNAKLILSRTKNFIMPKKADKESIDANIKSLIPFLCYPITKKGINTALSKLKSVVSGDILSYSIAGRNEVFSNKLINHKHMNILKWFNHVLNFRSTELNYNHLYMVESTYPYLSELLNSLTTNELKKLIKITGSLLYNFHNE
uniref:Replicase n=1 Tax=Human respiratory syncytial virus TaxID=11250 RepID=A0A059TDP2_HRSV|nr:RNA-directed RNA polymerase L [Human orthopneumovirus]